MSAKEWRDFTEDHVWKLKENTDILNKTYMLSIFSLRLVPRTVVNTKRNKTVFLSFITTIYGKLSNFQ